MNVLPLIRGRDSQGAGYFGASRSGRKHNGIDVCSSGDHRQVEPGDPVRALVAGTVSKLGYPYSHDLSFRYVEIQDVKGYRARYFYVIPTVEVGDQIAVGDMIGTLQELSYDGITQHYHFEVVTGNGSGRVYHDPIKYLCGDLR